MSQSKLNDLPESLRFALTVETKNFEPIVTDLFDAADRGRFNLLLVGPATVASMSDEQAMIFAKKHGLTKEELGKYVTVLMTFIHNVVTGEIKEVTKKIEGKSPEHVESFRVKTRLVSEMLEKYPFIRDRYFVYSLCKTDFFAEMTWEAGLKVAHSPGMLPRGPVPSFVPFATIVFETFSGKEHPVEKESFKFEIAEKDLALMIDSLKNLKNAVAELKTKKLV